MQKDVKTIQRASQWGLWGSVALVLLTVAFIYLSPKRFYQSDYTVRWMLIAGAVLAGYAAHVRSTYLTMLAVVLLLCALTVLSGRNVLLMLALVSTLVLFLMYPNIYRIKVDLGLTDDEMRQLFGDRYIGGDAQ